MGLGGVIGECDLGATSLEEARMWVEKRDKTSLRPRPDRPGGSLAGGGRLSRRLMIPDKEIECECGIGSVVMKHDV